MNAEERALAQEADDLVTRAITVELSGGDGLDEFPDDASPDLVYAALAVALGTCSAAVVNWALATSRDPVDVWRCCLRLAANQIEEDSS